MSCLCRARTFLLALAALVPIVATFGCTFGADGIAGHPTVAWLGTPIRLADPSRPTTRHVVLITIDGVRWQELFGGVDRVVAVTAGMPESAILDARELTPNLHRRFFDGGAVIGAPGMGAGIFASGPNFISLPGYLEVLRGRSSVDCDSNHCPPTRDETLLDEIRDYGGGARADSAAFTSWDRCAAAASGDPARTVVSAGRTHGSIDDLSWVSATCQALLAAGRAAGPWPGHGDYRPDAETAKIALHYLSVVRPKMLWLGLGDTDEYAHRHDYPEYLDALRRADATIGALFDELDRMGEWGRSTTVFVTTDHGRGPSWSDHGAHPSASRVFLLAAGGSVPKRGLVINDQPYRLADIAPTIRALLALSTAQSDSAMMEVLPAHEGTRTARGE